MSADCRSLRVAVLLPCILTELKDHLPCISANGWNQVPEGLFPRLPDDTVPGTLTPENRIMSRLYLIALLSVLGLHTGTAVTAERIVLVAGGSKGGESTPALEAK